MFCVRLSKDDADKSGLVVGLGVPVKRRTRLGIVKLFNKLQATIRDHKDCPEDFSVWPVSIIMPCRRSYVYIGPDDFPLNNVPCLCKNPKHRPVVWTKNPSQSLKDAF